MTGDDATDGHDEQYSHVAALVGYTYGERDAEKDYAAGSFETYDRLTDIADEMRSNYEAGYVAGFRQAIEREESEAYRSLLRGALAAGGNLAARVLFDTPVTITNGESIETETRYDLETGEIGITEITKIHADGTRQRIAYSQQRVRVSPLARISTNLRERFFQWRQLFGSKR